jgi:signal transduction histidine kinase
VIGLRRALWAIAAAGALVLSVETGLVATAEGFADRTLWVVLVLVIGGGFLAVGLFAWYRRPENRVGTLMVATAFAWFVAVLARTESDLLWTVGQAFSNAFVAVAIHLLLAFPTGRIGSRGDRIGLAITYAVAAFGYIPALLFLDPALAGCASCPDNLILIEDSSSFARTWLDGLDAVGAAILLWVVHRLFARWRAASPPTRRAITPLFLAGALLMLVLASLLLIDLLRVSEDVQDDLYYAALVPFGLMPYLFLASLARARMLRGGAVSELIASIGGRVEAVELRDALARALNDPSLELAYWIPESESYVNAEGRRIDLERATAGRAHSDVLLDGRPVAALIHDPLLNDEPELIDAVGAAATLALEKERLAAALRAKVEALRESRARMLAFGLAERRRLERDLHDGAQQRLVSLALDLRLARTSVREDPERAEALLDGAAEELAAALEELRELARGIHPAVLSDRGLDPAVEAIASRTPIPVEIIGKVGERLAEPAEIAAYFVVSEALTNVVKYANANGASVRVERDNGRLIVEVADDGVGGADPGRGSGLRGLGDRIAALGGLLEVESPPGAGTTVRARIPCE